MGWKHRSSAGPKIGKDLAKFLFEWIEKNNTRSIHDFDKLCQDYNLEQSGYQIQKWFGNHRLRKVTAEKQRMYEENRMRKMTPEKKKLWYKQKNNRKKKNITQAELQAEVKHDAQAEVVIEQSREVECGPDMRNDYTSDMFVTATDVDLSEAALEGCEWRDVYLKEGEDVWQLFEWEV
tara:strand:- start:49 stop:582 length:534 start_codon:yes stop_codon:yes gene_type:complete